MGMVEVVIALGTNLGKRVRNLSLALEWMKRKEIEVLRHSCLYETSPWGVLDQPNFLNAAVLATTDNDPIRLLEKLKDIEKEMGRDFGERRYGPRMIDLDIIFYGNRVIQQERLTIPHARWKERDFVKVPLKDLAGTYKTLDNRRSDTMTVKEQMTKAENEPLGMEETIAHVFPFGPDRIEKFGEVTWIMYVLNITPDSFSDGGDLMNEEGIDHSIILERTKKAIAHGVRILDIGGQSTRPGSVRVTESVEAKRVVPVIKMLKEALGSDCPYISVDTFYASVARDAVQAGADMINDVSAGTMDSNMLSTVAELKVPMILNHMRGTPQTMMEDKSQTYSSDPVKDVGRELQSMSEAAMKAGIPAWHQILDPGIGFAKRPETSFDLLINLDRLKSSVLTGVCSKMPLLVGLSRKRFLSAFTDGEPKDRDTVSCIAAAEAIRRGADILRVHNSKMTKEAVSLADALHRSRVLPSYQKMA